jgi:hypothetical protein
MPVGVVQILCDRVVADPTSQTGTPDVPVESPQA